jgi:hypothetical protein
MSSTINSKYLSIFIDRFIPPFWINRYPKLYLFIEYFLKYLESSTIFDTTHNFVKFRDLDYIASLLNSTDTTEQQLGNQLINNIYEEFLGDVQYRYISEMLDEILYLKNQKSIIQRKGTKNSFLFLFLIILGGYFRILDSTNLIKKHNGQFQYNGVITYNSTGVATEPFIYLIVSEFYPAQYERILKTVNPAGMKPYYIFNKLQYYNNDTTGSSIEDIFNKPYIYAIIYNETENLGMIKIPSIYYFEQVYNTTDYDYEMSDSTLWRKYSDFQTGVTSIFYNVFFNQSFLGDTDFTKITLISNPTTKSSYFYNPDEQDLTGCEYLYDIYITGGSQPVINNTNINIIINFN